MVLQIARQRYDQLRDRAGDGGAPSRPVGTYLATPPPYITGGLEVATRALGELDRDVRAGGGRLAIALMPARFQLDPAELRAAARRHRAVGRSAHRRRRHRALPRRDGAAGVPTLDLLPVLKAAPAGQFFVHTVHFTPAGHETVAAALDAFLQREGSSSRGRGDRVTSGTDASGLQLGPLRRLLRGRLRGLPLLGHRAQNLWLLRPATTSTPPGTGASPGCWRRRRWSAGAPAWPSAGPRSAPRGRDRGASSGRRSASCWPSSASSSTPASSSIRLRGRWRRSASTLGWPMLAIVLPLGISFYTFMAMAYVVDVYRGDMPPVTSLVDYALFVAYFPHLVAGPILRAPALMPQFAAPRVDPARAISSTGSWLIATGLFKKIVVADNLSPMVDAVFDPAFPAAGGDVLIATYAFALQIYGDFAGYSDMARGISQWFGIELNVNFRFPYSVTNPREFWRHWHISLSTWLRDYLYMPLGGSRGGAWATNRNLLITMVLGGLWHGAAWSFVLWGAYQGLWLVAHRGYEAWRGAPRAAPHASPSLGAWLVTLHLVCYGWLLFRARSFEQIRADDVGARSPTGGSARRSLPEVRTLVGFALPLVLLHAYEWWKDDLLAMPEAAAGAALRRLRRALLPDPAVRLLRRRAVHLLPVLGGAEAQLTRRSTGSSQRNGGHGGTESMDRRLQVFDINVLRCSVSSVPL